MAATVHAQMPQGEIPEISLGAQADAQKQAAPESNVVPPNSGIATNPWLSSRFSLTTLATIV
ncbi:MAG: hypothetical protein ACXW2Q_03050, partial [Thermoanaerobaculia bacterium]